MDPNAKDLPARATTIEPKKLSVFSDFFRLVRLEMQMRSVTRRSWTPFSPLCGVGPDDRGAGLRRLRGMGTQRNVDDDTEFRRGVSDVLV